MIEATVQNTISNQDHDDEPYEFYSAWLVSRFVHCSSQSDADAVSVANAILVGEQTAAIPSHQLRNIAEVLLKYRCNAAATVMLDLAAGICSQRA